ncbi:MAG: hypothetical protein Fur0046_16760 [Cyanobacteria bacterium J069]
MAKPQFLPVAVAAAVAEVEQVMQRPPLALPDPQPLALLVEMFVTEPQAELESAPVAIPLEMPALLHRPF